MFLRLKTMAKAFNKFKDIKSCVNLFAKTPYIFKL